MHFIVSARQGEQNDIGVLNKMARDWVETGWRHTFDEPFDFRMRLGRFYDWSADGTRFFDDFDQQRRVNHHVAQYAAIWDGFIPRMKRLTNIMVGEPSTLVSSDLAVMSVQFVTSFIATDGHEGRAHTLSSLVWHRTPDGWRIIREHGSALNPNPQ